jgi:trimeric autotransporter adhesin
MSARKSVLRIYAVLVVVGLMVGTLSPGPAFAAPAGTAFTYQGKLTNSGAPVNGTCDLSFGLWDAVSAGNFLDLKTLSSVPIGGGLFTVELDYGAGPFTGQARWLESSVKCAGDANYVTLSPRTQLTATPYALFSLNNWALGGNIGTGGTGFVGTTDNTALTIGVYGQAALRIYPHEPQSPNIAGGYSGNTIDLSMYGQTIAGGGSYFYENRVMNNFGTVGGGRNNHAEGYGSTIAGGIDNQATNDYTTVAGGLHNYATGSSSGIGGGFNNTASGYVAYIGGGDLNVASTQNATIGGGYDNEVGGGASIANGTIGGGVFNLATGFAATIAGGHGNHATAEWSSIGGGGFNKASGARSATVSGGEYNIAGGTGSTVGGGGWTGGASSGNQALGTASTIGGGYGNLISADGGSGTIGGGAQNQITALAGTNLNLATIGGGYNNKVALGGGTVGGGNTNTTSGFDATVAGGNGNTASGAAATVPGGNSNLAQGNFSFAAGYRAKSYNNGCFTWADTRDFDFGCFADNAFTARATGGVFFVTAVNGAGTATAGVQLLSGSGAWSTLSDRDSKANFASVDARWVMEKLAAIPISTWNYRAQDATVRHIGPMAQDFAAAFNVGEDDRHITTIDADGVSLAAIQGLYQIVQEKDRRIGELEAELKAHSAALVRMNRDFEARLAALENTGNVAGRVRSDITPIARLGHGE